MKLKLAAYVFSILFASCSALQTSAPTEIVKFEMAQLKGQSRRFIPVRLDENGIGSIPFGDSKLLFKYENKKVYFDSDFDGKFAGPDENPIQPGKLFSVPLKLNEAEYRYEMKVLFVRPKMIYLGSFSEMAGEYKGVKIHLIDKNLNGDFSEEGIDMVRLGDNTEPVILGDIISIGSQLLNLKIEDYGRIAEIKLYEKLKGKLKITAPEKSLAQFTISHIESKFSTSIISGEEKVIPAGEYKILRASYFQEGPDNKRKRQNLISGKGGILKISEGENVFKAGTPFKIEFKAVKSAKDPNTIKIQSVSLVDSLGTQYRAQVNYAKEKSSLLSFIRSGNKEQQLSIMSYG